MTALATLAQVKEWLQIPANVTKNDALLQRLIDAASEAIEVYCNRVFSVQPYTETRNGHGGDQLVPTHKPIVDVTQVLVDWREVVPSPGGGRFGFVHDDSVITLFGLCFTRAKMNVTVSYTAGFATVPADVVQACVETVGLRFKELDRIGMVSKQLAGEVVSFSQKDFSDSTRTALDQRRDVVPS